VGHSRKLHIVPRAAIRPRSMDHSYVYTDRWIIWAVSMVSRVTNCFKRKGVCGLLLVLLFFQC